MSNIETSQVVGQMINKDGCLWKKVTSLPDFNGRIPVNGDFVEYVGGAINLLNRFNNPGGIFDRVLGGEHKPFIPRAELYFEKYGDNVEFIRKNHLGGTFWIVMPQIKGQRMSDIDSVPYYVTTQVEDFINRTVKMAEITKNESSGSEIIIPDILGGVHHPHSFFCNFMIENITNRLYFVDVYPITKIPTGNWHWWLRKKYVHHLRKAGKKLGNDQVIQAVEDLVKIIIY